MGLQGGVDRLLCDEAFVFSAPFLPRDRPMDAEGGSPCPTDGQQKPKAVHWNRCLPCCHRLGSGYAESETTKIGISNEF